MTVSTVDQYGAPVYGALGRPPAGVVFHTPENVDHTLAQAIAVAKWQASPSNKSGGSYHGILGYDAARGSMDDPDAWVMVRTVPWDKACGGVTSARTNPPWNPGRYPFLKKLLPAAAYADPNKWMHQIALSGKASWYVKNGYPKGLLIRLAEWVKLLEDAYDYDSVLTLHRWFQTNRSDPGPETLAELVLAEYERLNKPKPPAPVPPGPIDYRALYEAEKARADTALETIADLKNRIAAAKSALG